MLFFISMALPPSVYLSGVLTEIFEETIEERQIVSLATKLRKINGTSFQGFLQTAQQCSKTLREYGIQLASREAVDSDNRSGKAGICRSEKTRGVQEGREVAGQATPPKLLSLQSSPSLLAMEDRVEKRERECYR